MNTSEREDLPTVLEVLGELAKNSALPKTGRLEKIPHSRKPTYWKRTEIYTSHQIKYVRFRWGKGRESWGYLHISGGCCTNPVVQQRRKAVDEAIAAGQSLEAIKKLIASWDNAKPGRKPGNN